jgi:hypothetical protein
LITTIERLLDGISCINSVWQIEPKPFVWTSRLFLFTRFSALRLAVVLTPPSVAPHCSSSKNQQNSRKSAKLNIITILFHLDKENEND